MRGARADRREVRGARAVPRHPQGVRSGPAAADRQGQRLLLRPLRPPQGDQGRRGRGVREGRRDRQGLLPPERDRAGPDRAAGLPRRARERRPADRLHLHAGDVLHDGRARRAPPARSRAASSSSAARSAAASAARSTPPPSRSPRCSRSRPARPVRWIFTREEEMLCGSVRASWHVEMADALTKDGWILGRKVLTLHDAGAYTRFSSYGATKHSFHLAGAYTVPALRTQRLRRLVEPRADDRHARLRRDLGVVRDRAADDPQRATCSASIRGSSASRTPTARATSCRRARCSRIPPRSTRSRPAPRPSGIRSRRPTAT